MKEWILPINPKQFNIDEYLNNNDTFIWKAKKPFKNNDIVYVYLAKPVQAVCYKCVVINQRVDAGTVNNNSYAKQYNETKYAQFKVIESYSNGLLPWNELHDNGLGQVLLPTPIYKELKNYIENKTRRE